MNIFYVDKDPVIAAQMMCDKHVVKMILETAQMLFVFSQVMKQQMNLDCIRWLTKIIPALYGPVKVILILYGYINI